MKEFLQKIIPDLEVFASIAEAEYRAAEKARDDATERYTKARDTSAALEELLRAARDICDGTFSEVPL